MVVRYFSQPKKTSKQHNIGDFDLGIKTSINRNHFTRNIGSFRTS